MSPAPKRLRMPEWRISDSYVPYLQAVEDMEKRVTAIKEGEAAELLWLLEHESLYTAGRSAKSADLLVSDYPVYEASRGGQYTYHGPGQRIIYTLLDLKKRMGEPDIRRFVWLLEEWIIRTLKKVGVTGERREGRIGIWVRVGTSEKKVAALGIKVRHWISFHGISVNIHPDLTHYGGIIPCGIQEFGVTSLKELGVEVTMKEFDSYLESEFQNLPWW